MYTDADGGSRSRSELRPLWVALVALLTIPVGAFLLGGETAGRKLNGAWLWPTVIGVIPVAMGLIAAGRSVSRRSTRGFWAGALAVVLGAGAIYLGWMALLMGALQRDGVLF
jgi:hypothetical protein